MPSGRRRAREESDDDETQPTQRRPRYDSDDEGADSDQMANGDAQTADDQLAKKLVRYAISCEYSRTPIRRDGIKEKVLGTQGRSFKRIFALTQQQLRLVWGMELRELPVREKMTLHEKRKAMASNAQPKTGSGSYILVSVLPTAYRTVAIVAPSRAPGMEDEATYVAFYTLIVSTIWLSGGELSDQKLKRFLERLNSERNVSSEKTEMVLKKMERQGYVVRRVDRPPVGQDGENVVTWHIGTRAKEEIGLDGVHGMVREVYGDMTPELEKKMKASLRVKDRPQADAEDEQGDATQIADQSVVVDDKD
ncbi:uncharacterized protein J7T54_007492 [Emericellopsis cladophorae]|uniref:MAGE domain-containing protein n=1 Tax=Emericellopsis cladophorae TaxID=2686198 RepID=A0A9P9XYL1_9HYPO|nr:uncharacterized protein J7T54_007492 [Emericellopsis cladophorae]KAI6780016.1 hypothetical protein J7T54_007492 [Emericellopsis cladophorae]